MGDVVVCIRRVDLDVPHVASVVGRCSSCRSEVWISLATDEDLRDRPGMRVACSRCVVAEIAVDAEPPTFQVTDRTRHEAAAELRRREEERRG